METFSYVNISTELVLSILAFAARPDFAQTDEYTNAESIFIPGWSRTRFVGCPELADALSFSDFYVQ
ncbi:hypothetical protein AZE42_12417 [Rhizopogon vesiculosus]|uniref:Uncharacterized protein n=1 Tax=Rhizopogon vesiculosus TaxID=180088 RepID=A0A1J8PWT4_9AGAM|nr:hypothetical protein AZE42_12417 [Rhizopogon vesiculosus]